MRLTDKAILEGKGGDTLRARETARAVIVDGEIVGFVLIAPARELVRGGPELVRSCMELAAFKAAKAAGWAQGECIDFAEGYSHG